MMFQERTAPNLWALTACRLSFTYSGDELTFSLIFGATPTSFSGSIKK